MNIESMAIILIFLITKDLWFNYLKTLLVNQLLIV